METIAEHNILMSILKPGSWILDVGCYGFDLYKHMKSLGHNVVAVDIQHLSGYPYHRVAISDYNGLAYIEYSNDKQATKISKKETAYPIACETLEKFTSRYCLGQWDLIKLDCEGSEKEIIMSMTRPMAKQISVEFHLHTGAYTEEDVKNMVYHLIELGYEVISHDKTAMHGMSPNYWSSLFVLSDYLTIIK